MMKAARVLELQVSSRADSVSIKAVTIFSALVQCSHILLFAILAIRSRTLPHFLDISGRVYHDLQSPARVLLPQRLRTFSVLDADAMNAAFLSEDEERGVPDCGSEVQTLWAMPAWALPPDDSGFLDLARLLVRVFSMAHLHITNNNTYTLHTSFSILASAHLPCACTEGTCIVAHAWSYLKCNLRRHHSTPTNVIYCRRRCRTLLLSRISTITSKAWP
jgi:hypothetical protein